MLFNTFFPSETIISETKISPVREDQASDIWRVKTDRRELIIRASRTEDIDTESCFFNSVFTLFGVDPSHVFAMETVNHALDLPDLISVRMVYRYLYRLIGIQDDEDIDEWFARPVLFD